MKTNKLEWAYTGPYRVQKVLENGNYELFEHDMPRGMHNKFHESLGREISSEVLCYPVRRFGIFVPLRIGSICTQQIQTNNATLLSLLLEP